MFKLMSKKINANLGAQTILIWTYVILIVLLKEFVKNVNFEKSQQRTTKS